jgi:hypothetical protein
MAFFDNVDPNRYYEVREPKGEYQKIRLETLSLADAQTFVRNAWEKKGQILGIVEVTR